MKAQIMKLIDSHGVDSEATADKIMNLIDDYSNEIAIERLHSEPLNTIAHVALLKMANIGIETNASKVEQTTEATLHGERYSCSMEVTWVKIKTAKKDGE